jgi:hypothetical protein
LKFTASEKSSPSSKTRFQSPNNVQQLASQAAFVGTLLLNGELEPEQARTYSALVRSVAQLISAEVARARIAKGAPNLSLAENLLELAGEDDKKH